VAAGAVAPAPLLGRGPLLLQVLLSALQAAMRTACAHADVPAWCAAGAASADVLAAAHRADMLPGLSDAASPLAAHISLMLQQCVELQSAPAAAAAACRVVCSLVDADVRLLEPHLQALWHAIWAGGAQEGGPCEAAACCIILAYGDTRQLATLLPAVAAALCTLPGGCDARPVMCAPAVAAAWSVAAARLPAAQVPSVLQSIGECLAQGAQAQLLGGGSVRACALLPALAETLAAALAGMDVTPAAAAATGLAVAALQARIEALLRVAGGAAAELAAGQASRAMLLRLSSLARALAQHCAAQAGGGEEEAGARACILAADDMAARLTEQLLLQPASALAPWLHLEASRAAMLRAVWADRLGDAAAPLRAGALGHLQRLVQFEALQGSPSVAGWDGVLSTVDDGSLSCALWQLCTEHLSTWCVALASPVLSLSSPRAPFHAGARARSLHLCTRSYASASPPLAKGATV
jgi:hypothetical protein